MKVREVALDCLSRIMLQKSYSHIDLDHTLKTAPLNEKDKALLTNIVYGTLQHANLLKWEISLHIKNDKTHPKMMILLMMSLYQMRYLDKIPNYAILNEAVNLAKKLDGNWGGRFCNGVLRTLSREKKEPQLQDFKTCEEYYHISPYAYCANNFINALFHVYTASKKQYTLSDPSPLAGFFLPFVNVPPAQ